MAPPRPALPPSLVLALGLTANVNCGPCLKLAVCLDYSHTGEADTDTDTDADSDTDTDVECDSGSCLGYTPPDTSDTGPTSDTSAPTPTPTQILEQMLQSGVLPQDVGERLRPTE